MYTELNRSIVMAKYKDGILVRLKRISKGSRAHKAMKKARHRNNIEYKKEVEAFKKHVDKLKKVGQ